MTDDPTLKFYNERVSEYEEKTKDLLPMRWMNAFMQRLPKKSRILDIGCGFGRDAKVFHEQGFEVIGVDFSAAMIKRAKEYVEGPIFKCMDMRSLDFPSEFFDGVWAMTSLLHLKRVEVDSVLKSIYSILAPGGFLFVGAKIGEGEGLEDETRYENAQRYYLYFSENELAQFLNKAGFTIVESVHRKPKIAYENKSMIELIAQKT